MRVGLIPSKAQVPRLPPRSEGAEPKRSGGKPGQASPPHALVTLQVEARQSAQQGSCGRSRVHLSHERRCRGAGRGGLSVERRGSRVEAPGPARSHLGETSSRERRRTAHASHCESGKACGLSRTPIPSSLEYRTRQIHQALGNPNPFDYGRREQSGRRDEFALGTCERKTPRSSLSSGRLGGEAMKYLEELQAARRRSRSR